MSTAVKERLRKEIEDTLTPVRNLAKDAEDAGRDLTDGEREQMKKALEAVAEIKNRIAAVDSDAEMVKQLNALGLEHGATARAQDIIANATKGMSVGDQFFENDQIKSWMSSIIPTKGNVPEQMQVHSPAVQFGGIKNILAGGNTTDGPGLLVQPQQLGLIEQGLYQRELTLRSLVNKGRTSTDTINWVQELAYTNNAAPVPEARGVEPYVSGSGNVRGAKPQSSFTLEKAQTNVITIAHWIPVTKRALSDATQIRSLIDAFLRYGLEEELEDQMLLGTGGDGFTGILETEGILEQEFEDNVLDTCLMAKTKVRTIGKGRPSAYLLSPEDDERLNLMKGYNGYGDPSGYTFGGPAGNQVNTLWGLPRVICDALPAGTGIVADWSKAMLWDREEAAILATDSHADFFIRNMVAILAELRAAFTVIRPSAFVVINMTQSGS